MNVAVGVWVTDPRLAVDPHHAVPGRFQDHHAIVWRRQRKERIAPVERAMLIAAIFARREFFPSPRPAARTGHDLARLRLSPRAGSDLGGHGIDRKRHTSPTPDGGENQGVTERDRLRRFGTGERGSMD